MHDFYWYNISRLLNPYTRMSFKDSPENRKSLDKGDTRVEGGRSSRWEVPLKTGLAKKNLALINNKLHYELCQ